MLMPAPVVGATLIFTACAILKGGIETIAARMYDSRKTLVVGLSIFAGLAVEAFPHALARVPEALQPLTVSSLVFGTSVGFLLNLVFRIGLRKRETVTINPATPDVEALGTFIEQCGAGWGARRDVVMRAEWAVQELVGAVASGSAPRGPLTVSASFDEFNLDLELRYIGEAFPVVTQRPSLDEIAESPDGAHRLAAFLLHRRATKVTSTQRGEACTVRLKFEH
jgi:NCS2 family nucleobase:cation symporter-2